MELTAIRYVTISNYQCHFYGMHVPELHYKFVNIAMSIRPTHCTQCITATAHTCSRFNGTALEACNDMSFRLASYTTVLNTQKKSE